MMGVLFKCSYRLTTLRRHRDLLVKQTPCPTNNNCFFLTTDRILRSFALSMNAQPWYPIILDFFLSSIV